MESKVAGLALILRTNIIDEDGSQGWRKLSDVAITNDLGRIGLVNRHDQVGGFERTLKTNRRSTGFGERFDSQTRLRGCRCWYKFSRCWGV